MNRYTLRDIISLSAMSGFGLVLSCSGLILIFKIEPGFGGRASITGPEIEYLAGMVCAVLGLLLLGWIVVGALAALASIVFSRCGFPRLAAMAHRITPGLLYRLVAVTLGGTLALAPAAQAVELPSTIASALMNSSSPAAPGNAPFPPVSRPDSGASPDSIPGPGWQPQQLMLPLKRLLGGATRNGNPDEVVVAKGDSLWRIAREHLGPDAQIAEVARAWPLWYEANRRAVGPDPDRLDIGMVLKVPTLNPTRDTQ